MVFQFPGNYEFNFESQEEQIRANDIILDMFNAQFLPAAYGSTDHPDGVEEFRQRCTKRFVTKN
jgi:hypothetical protein